ncbi:MAG TPA: LysR substrate-binding domain-containing protein [Burkholderiaceae bacterium]|nr:LysR substrate-binding domain-containing protein [Burkholderiaceae bacterium]
MIDRRLPSLLALRAFASAAEHSSFTEAARELNVTQAAISRHVRGLEDDLGQAVFRRLHRRVELTPVGERLARELAAGFTQIHAAVQAARKVRARRLRLTVEPAFAARWLVPRLDDFGRKHPDIVIELETSNVLRQLGEEADVAIRYTMRSDRRPTGKAQRLFSCEVVPVIGKPAGRAARGLRRDESVLGRRLLHDDQGELWAQWFVAAGLDIATAAAHQHFSDYSIALDAAERGAGVALGAVPFIQADLAKGWLARVGSTGLMAGAYWVVESGERASAKQRAAFVTWLLEQAARTVAGN